MIPPTPIFFLEAVESNVKNSSSFLRELLILLTDSVERKQRECLSEFRRW